MYYNPDLYVSEINSYRRQLTAYLERDKPLVHYFYEKLAFDIIPDGKDFGLNDYYDRNTYGFTNVDLVTTLSDSLIISIYGKYEYLLGVLCEVVQRALGLGISYKMIKGQGVIASVNYLDSVLNINIREHDLYKKIDIWRVLRNIMAHNYSVPEEKHYVQLDKIGIHTNGEIENVVTSMNDCIRLIDTFESFFEMVFDKLLTIVSE